MLLNHIVQICFQAQSCGCPQFLEPLQLLAENLTPHYVSASIGCLHGNMASLSVTDPRERARAQLHTQKSTLQVRNTLQYLLF